MILSGPLWLDIHVWMAIMYKYMLTFKIFYIKESPLKSDELKAYTSILHYWISYVHYCSKRDITLLNNYKYPKIKIMY